MCLLNEVIVGPFCKLYKLYFASMRDKTNTPHAMYVCSRYLSSELRGFPEWDKVYVRNKERLTIRTVKLVMCIA